MYSNTTCEPQKEITFGQIIEDNHETLLDIETEVDEIRRILLGINNDEVKASNPSEPRGMIVALADDVITGKKIVEKLNYIVRQLI